MSGFSAIRIFPASGPQFTIHSQLGRVGDRACRVGGPAGVQPTVLVVNMADIEETDLTADHGGGQTGVGGHHLALQAPGDGDRQVASLYVAHYGSSLALVYWSRTKRKWNNFWRF